MEQNPENAEQRFKSMVDLLIAKFQTVMAIMESNKQKRHVDCSLEDSEYDESDDEDYKPEEDDDGEENEYDEEDSFIDKEEEDPYRDADDILSYCPSEVSDEDQECEIEYRIESVKDDYDLGLDQKLELY